MTDKVKENVVSIDKRLSELDELIAETQDRMPAHSAKPQIMSELFELEDEYHMLRQKREQILYGQEND